MMDEPGRKFAGVEFEECTHALCGSRCLCSCKKRTGMKRWVDCPVHDPNYVEPEENATHADYDADSPQPDEIGPQAVADWLREWASDLSEVKTVRARMLEHAALAAVFALTDEFGF